MEPQVSWPWGGTCRRIIRAQGSRALPPHRSCISKSGPGICQSWRLVVELPARCPTGLGAGKSGGPLPCVLETSRVLGQPGPGGRQMHPQTA